MKKSIALSVLLLAATVPACGPKTVDATSGTGGVPAPFAGVNGNGTGGKGGSGSDKAFDACAAKPCEDFPAAPLSDNAPANAADLFGPKGAGTQGAGPCLVEPEPGTLMPSNWIRPRFRWMPMAGQTLFELRIHSDRQKNDLVVHTTSTSWTMPAKAWTTIASHLRGTTMQITVRALDGAKGGTPAVTGPSDLSIAPVGVGGSIVYWTTKSADAFDAMATELQGFEAGQEDVKVVLRPTDVEQTIKNWNPTEKIKITCIGCHTSTPDGLYAGFTAQPPWANVIAGIKPEILGKSPPFLTPAALDALSEKQLGVMTFSGAHWRDGDHMAIVPWGDDVDTGVRPTKLAWIDLEAKEMGEGKAYGFLDRTGDARSIGAPRWSHNGQFIVYTSTAVQTTGRIGGSKTGQPAAATDLFTVLYNDRKGGTATPVMGASDPGSNETYPDLSPDDALVSFNRVPLGVEPYDQPNTEIWIASLRGGSSVRLAANDPVACSGKKSPGVTNSWAKWAPDVAPANGGTYYWLTFSSKRGGDKPQLYIAPVVVTESEIKTFPALYLWNQKQETGNHTPAWDVFVLSPG